jgi:hypothetical protein
VHKKLLCPIDTISPAALTFIFTGIRFHAFLLLPTPDADADIIILTSAENGV